MRLIHAITASDLQNSGHPYTTAYTLFRRIGRTPLYMYLSYANVCYSDPEGLRFSGNGVYLTLPVGRAIAQMKEGEVVGCGYYLAPVLGFTILNSAASMLRVASYAGEENLFLWSDVWPYTAGGNAAYIEYSVSYDLKTWSLYVNGKFVKSVQATLNHVRNTLNFYLHGSSVNGSNWYYIRDVYAAIFDPTKERASLGRWSCEALAVGTSEFPNAVVDDDVFDKLNAVAKVIEFTYSGVRRLESVALIGSLSPTFPETLDATLISGASSVVVTSADLPIVGTGEDWVGKGTVYSLPLGSVDFDNVSKKVTASLKLKS